jgi:predicted RNA-binding Zn-ribbon protein involved in translation (DUF1610 family)
MKMFKGKLTDFMCPGCGRWIHLQSVRLVRKVALPARFSDGKDVVEFKRTYECPKCGGFVLRCPR